MEVNLNKFFAKTLLILGLSLGGGQCALKATEIMTLPVEEEIFSEIIPSPKKSLNLGIDPYLNFKDLGLSWKDFYKVCLKNDALFINISKEDKTDNKKRKREEFEFDFSEFSPSKVARFCEEGGEFAELEHEITLMKKECPHPIRNPNYPRSSDFFYSPAIRNKLSRPKLLEARRNGLVKKIFADAFEEPIPEETEEERRIRKETQERDFLDAESRRGKIPNDLQAELRKELEIWQDHLNYIAMRKSQLLGMDELITDDDADEEDGEIGEEETIKGSHQDNSASRRIRRGEIEDSFFKFVAPNLSCLTINEGYDVYFTKETLDLDRLNYKKLTNLENMESGKCPIGPDHQPMNYHHLTHYDYATHKVKSVIVLITHTLHTTYSGKLHFGRTTYRDLPQKKVIRSLFDRERENFNQVIANYYTSEKIT